MSAFARGRCRFVLSRLVLGALSLLLGAPDSAAVSSTLDIERIAWSNASAEGVRVLVDLDRNARRPLLLEVARLSLPAGLAPLEQISITCAKLSFERRALGCRRAALRYVSDGVPREAELALNYAPLSGALTLNLDGGAGSLLIEVALRARGAPVLVRGKALKLPALGAHLGQLFTALAAYQITDGELDVEVLSDAGGGWSGALRFRELAFSDPSGRIASEALALAIDFRAERDLDNWRGEVRLTTTAGGIYAEPVYLDIGAYGLDLASSFAYEAATGILTLPRFSAIQSGVVELKGSLISTPAAPLEELHLDVTGIKFPAAYDTWLKGVMVGTPLAALDTAGEARAHVEYRAGQASRLQIELDAMNIEERNGLFALYGLEGDIYWTRSGADINGSSLGFSGGYFHGAGFGAARFELGIAGGAIDLLETARIPLLGGALVINQFSLRDYGSDDVSLGLEAALEPIELGQLTLALGWPAFSGTLDGRLPLLRYARGVVTVGGNLEARAFDGAISIAGLRVEQPLGIVPVISASVRLRNLDLEQVTEVVPFGRVSGRLDGDIDDLRLVKGEPVSFDARFRTPDDDDSKHRLSQRAVDTISRVAGGGAVLSTTFLRIFKHFAYDKLGISCRLQNDICHMDGVEQADEGYYIVKGASLPRVDLIGRVREVQWSRLMGQLKQALNEGQFKID